MALPLSPNEIRDRAARFAHEWADVTSERAEAQTFWNEFFEVFGRSRKRVGRFEHRVKAARERWERADDKKGGFIDLFWPGTLIAEHKSAGKDLDTAYEQALEYFDALPDHDLPRYVIVSDFARIRVYDLEGDTQEEFRLKELPKKIGLFGFISGYTTQRIAEQDPVNIKAAEKMGRLHDQLKAGGYSGHPLEVLLVRLLFCLFAEDTTIFDQKDQFRDWIVNCTDEDGSDFGSQLAHLFQILNTPEDKRHKDLDERVSAFPHVNGKLFEETLPIASFNSKMRDSLLDCCALDWGRISPAIFGALFQSVMDEKARRSLGAHYTSEENILKLIKPLFLDDLRQEFEKASKNKNRLFEFHKKIALLRFLDPACGCGNFLVIAYRELRLLELDLLRATHELDSAAGLLSLVTVNVDQFYGIEIEEFPSQIAQVAMWLMDHQMNMKVSEEFGFYYRRLPLKHSPKIVCDNALRIDWNDVVVKEKLNYILGNPPFIGHHLQTTEQKRDMLAAIGDAKATGVLDYVSAWYAKAAAMIKGTKIAVGFVSTNSITQGEQVGILWRALGKYGEFTINFAHRTFRWSNEARGKAAVYCVVIGFSAEGAAKKVIYDYPDVDGEPHAVSANFINAYLVDAPWVLLENRSHNPFGKPEMMYGSKPTDDGNFLFTDEEKIAFLKAEPAAAKYIKPFMSAHEYLHGEKRWVLWLVGADPSDIKKLPGVQSRVEAVAAFRRASKAASTRDYLYPTLFRQVTQPDSDYVLIPRHSSENRLFIPFGFFGKENIVADSCMSLPRATLTDFGILQSTMHMAWVRYTCGRLESRYRYSKDIVYNNFPWPLDLEPKAVTAIDKAAQSVLNARLNYSNTTLADLYGPLSMPPDLRLAHKELDKAVDAAYGRKKFSSDAERVAFLFDLYQRYTTLLPAAEKPKRGKRKTH